MPDWQPEPDGEPVGSGFESPFNGDRRGPSQPAASAAPARPSSYGAAESSPVMPTSVPTLGAPALELPEPAMVTMALVETPEPPAPPSVPAPAVAPPVPDGGPQFGAAAAVSAPVGPPGVRAPYGAMPAMQSSGTLTPSQLPRQHSKSGTSRRWLTVVLILTVVAGAAVVAYPKVKERLDGKGSVPKDLRAYVAGKGVAYAPAGQGYSVRLPSKPVQRDSPLTLSDHKLSVVMHRSTVAGTDFQIAVREGELPSETALADGLAGALHDPLIAGTESPLNAHRRTFAGQNAYDYDVRDGSGTPIRCRIVLHGKRLYVITVQSESDEVFGAVVKSFRLVS